MSEDSKIIEKDGKKYCSLPDGSQVLIENEIIGDPNWVVTTEVEKKVGVGDRQVRNLAKKYNWQKKYAYINKKPVAHYYAPEIESFQRDRVTEAMVAPADPNEEQTNTEAGKGVVSKETLGDLDAVLKKMAPYVSEFLEAHKKDRDRLVVLEEKKAAAEKSAVFWKTSAIFVTLGCVFAAIAWYKADHVNSTLSKSASDLSGEYVATQKELYDTKTKLLQREYELNNLNHGNGPNNVQNSEIPGKRK